MPIYLSEPNRPEEPAMEARVERIETIMSKNPFMGMDEKEMKELRGRKIDGVPHDYTLYNKYMPIIKANYPKNEMTLMKHIRDYKQKNYSILSTIYPIDYPVYGNEDAMIIFRVTGIDPAEMTKDIKAVKIPSVNFEITEKKNWKADLTVLIMIYQYYFKENNAKDMPKADIVLYYIGYAMYWSVYNKFFKKFKPNPEQMRYSIDTANNKFILKDPMIHSIDNLIRYCVGGAMVNNVALLLDPFDLSYPYVIDSLKTSLTGKMNRITNKFMEDAKDPNKRTFISKDDPENYGEGRSTSLDVEALSSKYSTKFLAQASIDAKCLQFAVASSADVSEKALRITIQDIIDRCDQTEVQTFFESMFFLYINDPEEKDPDLQNRKRFFASMQRVFKKGRTNNKNDIIIKQLLDKWLNETNPTFAKATRDATQTNYRKAVFMYFVGYILITK